MIIGRFPHIFRDMSILVNLFFQTVPQVFAPQEKHVIFLDQWAMAIAPSKSGIFKWNLFPDFDAEEYGCVIRCH